jgi:hypothetical protein
LGVSREAFLAAVAAVEVLEVEVLEEAASDKCVAITVELGRVDGATLAGTSTR